MDGALAKPVVEACEFKGLEACVAMVEQESVDGSSLAGWVGTVAIAGLASMVCKGDADTFGSEGSDEGGSEPMSGFTGVRKGDLNGLWSVLAASFSRRRLACGVGIFA